MVIINILKINLWVYAIEMTDNFARDYLQRIKSNPSNVDDESA